MKNSQLYAVLGFLFGWGAPLGALVLRYCLSSFALPPYSFVQEEWGNNSFFYWYMLAGTCLVFTVIGMVLGRHEDLEIEKNRERVGS